MFEYVISKGLRSATNTVGICKVYIACTNQMIPIMLFDELIDMRDAFNQRFGRK